MRVITDLKRWAALRRKWRGKGFSVGFVPTMGALHAGHVSLVERSVREHDRTVVSVFVNPTQFNDKSDLSRYPRTPRKDAALLTRAGADCLLMPDFSALYPDGYAYRVSESRNSKFLCGASRPGHFDGVRTLAAKDIHDPLLARVVVLRDGKLSLAIVSVDLLLFSSQKVVT
ncbi:MAG: adenylyltransferase/cytidyltransferase family protein, partial [Elusimicrobia bacterium]|nr:adenylyltransferase/cytidyltransferase family protein [Elusimicrobiota bacterium]